MGHKVHISYNWLCVDVNVSLGLMYVHVMTMYLTYHSDLESQSCTVFWNFWDYSVRGENRVLLSCSAGTCSSRLSTFLKSILTFQTSCFRLCSPFCGLGATDHRIGNIPCCVQCFSGSFSLRLRFRSFVFVLIRALGDFSDRFRFNLLHLGCFLVEFVVV